MFKKAEPRLRAIQDEISKLGSTLSAAAAEGNDEDLNAALQALEEVCDDLKHSASGSWLGYHAYVYYHGLLPAPAGANFSQEWGLKDLSFSSLGSVGDWRQFDPRAVRNHILETADGPDIESLEKQTGRAKKTFQAAQVELASIFEVLPAAAKDNHLKSLFEQAQSLDALVSSAILEAWRPKGQVMTRDTLALGQGWKAPPHQVVLSEVYAIRMAFKACESLSEICQKMSSHIRRKGDMSNEISPQRIFIGHGRSSIWRELKDFLQDRLNLSWNEFNRVSAAGVPTAIRLGELLDDSRFALLVLTAEDETADGEMQARMNVIHEVGLFQGRMGFSKAIVLIEDGCTEFSNIAGLGQIRFPKGNIGAVFEQVREVLERERILP